MKRKGFHPFGSLVFLLFLPGLAQPNLQAQIDRGGVVGTVTDSSGALYSARRHSHNNEYQNESINQTHYRCQRQLHGQPATYRDLHGDSRERGVSKNPAVES